jgi:hypothetical protein
LRLHATHDNGDHRALRRPAPAVLAAFLTLIWVDAVRGQASTGGIRGVVRDDSGGLLVGVSVEAFSQARIGRPAVEATNNHGLYRFENLPIGEYTLTFKLQRFDTIRREGVRIEVGRSVELGVTMTVGAMQQSVTVSGESPVVDTVHAEYTSNFNRQLLENIPTTRTSWFDVVAAAAAVRSDPVKANEASFLLYGSSADQNSYQNDGIEVAAPSGGTVWSFPNPDTIEEVQVAGIGAPAEYSGFQGGVINIVTKSGSNQLRGSANYFYVGHQLVGNNTPGEEFPYHIQYQHDATFMVGGPLKKDRIWAIAMFELTSNRTSDVGVDPATAPENHNYKPFAKVNARLSGGDAFEFQFSDEYFQLPESPDILTPANAIRDEHGRNPIYVGRWTHTFGPRTLFETKGGGIYIRDHFDPHSRDFTTPGHIDEATGVTSVNTVETITRNNQDQTTLAATLSHKADDFKGAHDLKFGLQYSQGTTVSNEALAGGASYQDYLDLPYRSTVQTTSSVAGRVRTTGAFVQDNWMPSDRITLNLGIRVDHSLGDIPAADQLDPSFTRVVGRYAALPEVVTYTNTSPRVGASMRLDRAGKTVAKASYGRYYARLNSELFTAIAPGGPLTTVYDWNPTTGNYDLFFSSSNPQSNQAIDPNLKNEYDDQLFLGLERELAPDFDVNASFIIKKEKNFIRGRDVRSSYAPSTVVTTFNGLSQALTVFDRTTPSSAVLIEPTNRDDFRQDYKSFVLQAYKRLSHHWQLQASYQWERSDGLSDGSIVRTSTQQAGPGRFGADPNQLINAYGRLPTDSTHSIRVLATVQLPFAIQLAVRSVYESGRPYGRLVTVRGLSQGTANILAEPRGSYALPTRNDFGLRVGKDLKLPSSQVLRLSIDIQNLLDDNTPLALDNNSSHTATYGKTTAIFLPRRAMLGVRYYF